MQKPVFTCIAFFEGRKPAKYRKVSNVYSLYKFCSNFRNFTEILTSINIYDQQQNFVEQVRTYEDAYNFYQSYRR